jgi:glutathione peroxidase
MQSIYQLRINNIEGEELNFKKFEGKKILIVNVASECGYTPQYAQLEELYQSLSDQLVVIGFPCNDFGGQEPGSLQDIQNFCKVRYGVTFPLTEKVNIKGKTPHPIYKWLTNKQQNGIADSEVTWNFCKFLLDEKGQLIQFFPSAIDPASEEIIDLI